MSRMGIALLALALAGGVPGCARQAQNTDVDAQAAADVSTVDIRNDYGLAMDIWMVNNGVSRRLGSVGPGTQQTFTVNRSAMPDGTVDIFAQPMGGGPVVHSGSFTMQPGQTLEFTIDTHLTFSRATVR